jgi:hypothetical protein
MRAFVVVLPFRDRRRHAVYERVPAIAAVRLSHWRHAGLVVGQRRCCFAATWLFVTDAAFADCFQRTYDAYPVLDDQPVAEARQTARPRLSKPTPTSWALNSKWLNLVCRLNFGSWRAPQAAHSPGAAMTHLSFIDGGARKH